MGARFRRQLVAMGTRVAIVPAIAGTVATELLVLDVFLLGTERRERG